MNESLHAPPYGVRQVTHWYNKAQIDYAQKYIAMYIAYNSWYRQVTGTSNDREALVALKKRFVIWDDYCQGKTMHSMKVYMVRLTELTQREPLMTHVQYWNGEVENAQDWRSLIEYWYQVRCLIVHGAEVRQKYIWLAYETLAVFMDEILDRITLCLRDANFQYAKVSSDDTQLPIPAPDRFDRLQQKLYQKYIASPDVWQVDMQRTD